MVQLIVSILRHIVMREVIVYGAGTMGSGIAHTFALHGYQVVLVDLDELALAKSKQSITKNLERQKKKGIITVKHVSETLNQLIFCKDASKQLKSCDLVVEAVSENFDVKLKVLRAAEKLVSSKAILTTNTSSISITKLAAALENPGRFLGMHFMNPVPVMSLVEVIKGIRTTPQTVDLVVSIVETLDKYPVIVNDYPGFVANRILMPMINEAIYTLHEGIATVSAIDQIMQIGMSHPMGPLKLADFIGLDVCLAILKVMQDGFGNPKFAPCPLLENLVSAKMLGVKSGLGFYDWANESKNPEVNEYFNLL
jgi:3-hydroxybutyryl-CoA dehydrogenase